MSMHGAVQLYLVKQIIIPTLSRTGSEGAAGFGFFWLSWGSEGNHLDGHSVYVLRRWQN